MSKKDARTLTCALTGKKFEYSGVGRPRKYAPDVKPQRASKAKKAKR